MVFCVSNKLLSLFPPGHPALPSFLHDLGISYLSNFKHTSMHEDIQYSLYLFRQSVQENGAPSIHLKAAKAAATLSIDFDQSHCFEDFSVAINFLSEVAGLEQTILQRHANLHGHSEFVTFAVAIALHHHRFDLALEWLENSRCLVWNQLNQLRTPIDRLKNETP